MSMGKLRLSWGQNGNRSLDNVYVALANLSMYGGYTQGYVDQQGNIVKYKYLGMDRLANTHLQWEKTTSWNAGVDFGFLDNRITGSMDYYVMPTTDMIMNQSLPAFSGVSSITCNLGVVENKGFELSLTSQNIKNKDWEWSTTLGFTKYKNTIKHLYYEYETVLDAEGNVIETKESDDVSNNWFIGHPISAIWNYRVTGIWQADEATEAAKYGQRPGDPKVANNPANDTYNEDGTLKAAVYNNDDKEFLGQTAPPIQWSMRNDFTFLKNFNFSFNIYSYMGHKSLSTNYMNKDNSTSLITNGANIYAKEYWTLDNPTNKYARLEAKGPTGADSPGMLYDRSFIRLDNVSLAYTLPNSLTRKWNIDKVKIYGTIRNVAVWAKDWEYWDPETGGLAPRIYTLGLNLTF
jgi:YD repeat-containing protein